MKMNKVIFNVFLILVSFSGFSQDYFSARYKLNFDSNWDFSMNICSEGFGYTLQLEDGPEYDPEQRRIGFLRFDFSGNLLPFKKIYQDSVYVYGTRMGGTFCKLQNVPGYALAGYKYMWVPNGRLDQGILMRFDSNLDTLWTKSYIDSPPHDSSCMFDNFRQLSDNGFIITGGYSAVEGGAKWRIRLLQTDSLGNIYWNKYYGSGNTYFIASDVTPTSDGGYAISGGAFPYNTTSQDNDPIIIKTDSVGNQQWIKHLGNPDCCEETSYIDVTTDGNILEGSFYSDSCMGWTTYLSRINLVKIRNDGSVVWDKKYGVIQPYRWTNKVKVLPDGDIVAVGHYQFVSVEKWVKIAWMLRTDSAGNERWYREYQMMEGNFSENFLYNVIPTDDGGFAACGSVFPANLPDTGTQDSWVLKVDSLGCEAPGLCWVGENEILVKTFTPEKPFIIYPNPADDKVFVEFYENSNGAVIELFDLYGRSRVTILHPPNQALAEMDISALPPGIYVVRVKSGEKVQGTGKVVVK